MVKLELTGEMVKGDDKPACQFVEVTLRTDNCLFTVFGYYLKQSMTATAVSHSLAKYINSTENWHFEQLTKYSCTYMHP